MTKYIALSIFCFFLFQACTSKDLKSEKFNPKIEAINYFKVLGKQKLAVPYKSRVTYYFDNGLPYRWIERDSIDLVLTDFIYQYNDNWIRTGAKYKEPGEEKYSQERLVYSQDSMTVTTEWLDSTGAVYYRMIEELDSLKRTFSAAFVGDELHGYDTTYYTKEGFENRIYFTNIRGKVMNDRTFDYTQTNDTGDWIIRNKLMGDTLNEVQVREINYHSYELRDSRKFLDGIISSSEWSENNMSFSETEETLFLTRGKTWEKQLGFIAKKVNGLYEEPIMLKMLDTIYNGAISPSGNQILFTKRLPDKTEVWLTKRSDGSWERPINLSEGNTLEGGYFNWINEEDIYFYIPENEGDLVYGKLENNQIKIIDRLDSFNTDAGCEFSPFMDKKKRYIIFTRYLEANSEQQGVYISYNEGTLSNPVWSEEEKIDKLPYGWGAFISKDLETLYYTDGEDIYAVSTDKLGLKLNFDKESLL